MEKGVGEIKEHTAEEGDRTEQQRQSSFRKGRLNSWVEHRSYQWKGDSVAGRFGGIK